MNKRDLIIKECCYHYNYKFPKELWTAVLFFNGERITIEEFNKVASLFK